MQKQEEDEVSAKACEEREPSPIFDLVGQSGTPPIQLVLLACAVCVFGGMMLPTQTGMNVRMALILGHPLRAVLYSDFCAALTLALIVALSVNRQLGNGDSVASRSFRALTVGSISDFPNDNLSFTEGLKNFYNVVTAGGEWLLLLGCALGVYFVSMAIFLTPHIGPSIFFISLLLGQLTTSVVLDKTGYLWNDPRDVSPVNYAGIVLLFTGAVLFNVESFSKLKVRLVIFILYIALSILAGVTLVIGASVVKRIRYHVGSPFRAALVAFIIGVFGGALCNVVTVATNPNAKADMDENRWFAWFGGCLGALHVCAVIICPAVIGFSATFTCVVTGNLALSLTYDALGAFGFPKEKISALKIFAVGLVICAAVLVNWTDAMSQSLRRLFATGNNESTANQRTDDESNERL